MNSGGTLAREVVPTLMKTVAKVLTVTAAFAALHSLLASRAAKKTAANIVGERARNAFYRPFYNAQAVVTSGALLLYLRKLPTETIYHVRGWPGVAMHVGRVAAMGAMMVGMRQIGVSRLLGLSGVRAYARGEADVPQEPEAQGPALDPDRPARPLGPFRFSRHPLNFLALPVLWLSPRMTKNLFTFNCLATLYFWIGSWHEEARLKAAYGPAYATYRRQVKFLYSRHGTRLFAGFVE